LFQYFGQFLYGHDLGRLQQGSKELHALCWGQLIHTLGLSPLEKQMQGAEHPPSASGPPMRGGRSPKRAKVPLKVTQPTLDSIAKAGQLTTLHLSRCILEPGFLEHPNLAKLHTLTLDRSKVHSVTSLQNLRTLVLVNSQILDTKKRVFANSTQPVHGKELPTPGLRKPMMPLNPASSPASAAVNQSMAHAAKIGAYLTPLKNLTRLQIQDITDLGQLTHLQNLVHLHVAGQYKGFSALKKFPHLTSLNLQMSQLDPQPGDFAAMTRLSTLKFTGGFGFCDGDEFHLEIFTRLTDLTMPGDVKFDGLTNLTNLRLDNTAQTDFSALSKLTKLTGLSVSRPLRNSGKTPLLSHVKVPLLELRLSPTEDLKPLVSHLNLESLEFDAVLEQQGNLIPVTSLQTEACQHIAQLSNLKTLNIQYLPATQVDFTPLKKLRKLTCSQMDDTTWNKLVRNCVEIEDLTITNSNALSAIALKQISRLQKLTKAKIESNHTASHIAPHFENNWNLKNLTLEAGKYMDAKNRPKFDEIPGMRYTEIENVLEYVQPHYGGEMPMHHFGGEMPHMPLMPQPMTPPMAQPPLVRRPNPNPNPNLGPTPARPTGPAVVPPPNPGRGRAAPLVRGTPPPGARGLPPAGPPVQPPNVYEAYGGYDS